ncbi:MAG: anti-ECFsigma factor, ChrR [Bryobacterales bacterium]|nr:anti-ECFsigma factor, ChrR [Bryobacterales bacterium]
MKHPSDAELALYAGGDLGWVRQRLAERHVRNCGACQSVAADFSELRSEGSSFPKIQWNRLASEMQANIRLGLAAGECVGRRPARSFVSGQRLAVVGVLLGVLLVIGVWMQRPAPHLLASRAVIGTILEAAESGIQVREGRQTLRILNSSNHNVSYSVGGRGELGARSLDPDTGNVTITHVYGE